MRRSLLVAVLAFMMVVPATAGAAPPDTFEQDDFTLVHDFQNNLLVFWNVTREAYCEWLATSPEPGSRPEVVKPIPFRVVHAANGYVRVSYDATSYIELWKLDGEPGEGCDPTAGAAPWAVGTARVSLIVLADEGVGDILNKLHGQGKVTETAASGEWHYSFSTLWFPDLEGEGVRPVQMFNLSQKGQ